MYQIFYYSLIDFRSQRHTVRIRMISRYHQTCIPKHLQGILDFWRTILPLYLIIYKLTSCLMSYADESLAQKHRICLGTILGKIILITLQDFIDHIAAITIRACLCVCCHSLRHSTHQHETAERLYQLVVEKFHQRMCRIAIFLRIQQALFACCQQELIKRHRMNKKRTDPPHSKRR